MSATNILNYYVTQNLIKEIDHYMGIRKFQGHEFYHIKWYNFKKQDHRRCGASTIVFRLKSGKLYYENWSRNDESHRCNGICNITHFKNGNVRCESWSKNNMCHKISGPAMVVYYKNGRVAKQRWYRYGMPYNVDNIACSVDYHTDGSVTRAKYYIPNGGFRQIDQVPLNDYFKITF